MGRSEMCASVQIRLSVLGFIFLTLLQPRAIAGTAPESLAGLTHRLLPSVVNISTTTTIEPGKTETEDENSHSLDKLSGNQTESAPQVPQHAAALGSGFIIDASGLIVTNNHVVEAADAITVKLDDGTKLSATLVGRDEKTDLALLRVHAPESLTAARFGDSDRANIGDRVIAIGNPFGLGTSVSAGIVSARDRDIAQGPYDDFIQTDAAINRGNSGGPLFDADGNVVGVISALFSPSGGSVGIGFAIPSNMVRTVIAQLREHGRVRRGWIGVRIQPVTKEIAESLEMGAEYGALISEVTAGSPAQTAGLRNGDVITAIDGSPVTESRAMPRLIAGLEPGSSVRFEVLRAGQKQSVRVAVAKLEDDAGVPESAPLGSALKTRPNDFGLALAAVDASSRAKYGLGDVTGGVVVTNVVPDSPAAAGDFRLGDVVREVQNEPVSSPENVLDRVAAYAKAGRKAVLFFVSREGRTSYIALPLGS